MNNPSAMQGVVPRLRGLGGLRGPGSVKYKVEYSVGSTRMHVGGWRTGGAFQGGGSRGGSRGYRDSRGCDSRRRGERKDDSAAEVTFWCFVRRYCMYC